MKILVVDDHKATATLLASALRKAGEDATPRFDTRSAIAWLEAHRPDVVITDLTFDPTPEDPEPGNGQQIVAAARAIRPPADVIVFTAHGSLDNAVSAMREGAFDFLTKPVTVGQLWTRLEEIRVLRGDSSSPRPAHGHLDVDAPFLAIGPRSLALKALLGRIATAPAPVWISGEIGSGRGHVARTIHSMSGRPAPLHVLDPSRADTWEWPVNGTALLPDIDKLDLDLLDQLARRLREVPSGLRLLATSSDSPRVDVRTTASWRDVYFAIAVLVVEVPPLRDRREDIHALFHAALERFAVRYGREAPHPTAEQLATLHEHHWPGNLRELFNVAERMVIVGTDMLDARTAHAGGAHAGTVPIPRLGNGFQLADHLEWVEKAILVSALEQSGGDRREAGRLLGVERNALRYKLRKYGLLD